MNFKSRATFANEHQYVQLCKLMQSQRFRSGILNSLGKYHRKQIRNSPRVPLESHKCESIIFWRGTAANNTGRGNRPIYTLITRQESAYRERERGEGGFAKPENLVFVGVSSWVLRVLRRKLLVIGKYGLREQVADDVNINTT